MRALDDYYDKNYPEFVPLRTKVCNLVCTSIRTRTRTRTSNVLYCTVQCTLKLADSCLLPPALCNIVCSIVPRDPTGGGGPLGDRATCRQGILYCRYSYLFPDSSHSLLIFVSRIARCRLHANNLHYSILQYSTSILYAFDLHCRPRWANVRRSHWRWRAWSAMISCSKTVTRPTIGALLVVRVSLS